MITARRNTPLLILVFLGYSALSLGPLLMRPAGFAIGRGFRFSDLLISHWPNALLVKRSLAEWGQIPLWNPLILSGAPFAADPLSGLWYPPNWLMFFLPLGLATNLIVWLHLAWAGLGMYSLLTAEGLRREAALLGGLAFAGTPKLIRALGMGHLSLLEAVTWTPWILLAARVWVSALRHSDSGWTKRAGLLGGLLGLVFLADARWFIPVGGMVAAYALYKARSNSHVRDGESRAGEPQRRRAVYSIIVVSAFAFATAASLLLPLAEFVGHTTRSDLSPSERGAYAVPLERLVGILVPDLSGEPEWLVHAGTAVLCLAVIGALRGRGARAFWIVITLLAWVLSFHTPIYAIFSAWVPGVGFLRVPARWLFLADLGLAALAAQGLHEILEEGVTARPVAASRRAVLAVMSLAGALDLGLLFLLAKSGGATDLATSLRFATSALLALACLAAALLPHSGGLRRSKASLWIGLVAIDLIWLNLSILEVRPLEAALSERAGLAIELVAQQDGERVFSPSYSLPQQTAAAYGIELADGVNPLQLRAYRDFMATATGFTPAGYSVTLPPFPTGDPSTPWPMSLDTKRLGLLSVGDILAEYPIAAEPFVPTNGIRRAAPGGAAAEGLELVATVEGVFWYRNRNVRPRAWVLVDDDQLLGPWKAAGQVKWSPNRVSVEAQGPGTLVLSEVAFPGWSVWVDGGKTELRLVGGLLRGVSLTPGEHEIVFRYRPWTVLLGVGLTLVASLTLALVWRRR